MVDIVLKLVKPEIEVSAIANTVYDCALFRVYTPVGGSDSKITIRDSSGTLIGSMSQPAGFVEIINKGTTDTVESNTAILCAPVAWK